MDFQNINALNVRLNLLSGNLLPMTDNSSFPLFWRIYSIFIWLFELVYTISTIAGCFFVPKQKVLNDGIVSLVVLVEANFTIMRIHAQTALVQQLIRKLNDALKTEDENMRNIVITNLKPMETPFKFYLVIGTFSASFWCCMPFMLIYEKSTFYYSDFQIPTIYSKEPFSSGVFSLGLTITLIINIYIFIKKVSVDIYVTQLVSLITVQYQYIASRFVLIFQNCDRQSNNSFLENNSTDSSTEMKIKNLCRQHKNILYYSIAAMFVKPQISVSLLEGSMVIMYGSGSITQFYILCNCFQKLSEASSEITDKAFHEDWYRFNISVKRIFLMVMMASNNMDLRISLFEKFNLSLPSFMSILNQSYSIALLLLKMN